MADILKDCQADLDIWLPRYVVVGPTFKGDEENLQFFLDAFKLCWQPEKKYDTILSYQDSVLRIEFNAKEGKLGIWIKHLPVFQASLCGEVYICDHDPTWKNLLKEQAQKLGRKIPDSALPGGADQDVFPV